MNREHRIRAGIKGADVIVAAALFWVVTILIVLVLPPRLSGSRKGKGIMCQSNQRYVALGFALWVTDHGESEYPFGLPVSAGGTRELALHGDLLTNYLAIHQELDSPKYLTCPADRKRTRVADFYTQTVTEKNLSYFLNVQAGPENPRQVLLGDRTVTVNGKRAQRWAEAPAAAAFGITNQIHPFGGNVVLVDGSAHPVDDRTFRAKLREPENRSIRLLVP